MLALIDHDGTPLVTVEDVIRFLFTRLVEHGCEAPWNVGDDLERKKKRANALIADYSAVIVDNGVTFNDMRAAYPAILAIKSIAFRRFPSVAEVLEAINSRRPHVTPAAIEAEAVLIFQRAFAEIEGGRARGLESRMRETYGVAAAEAWAAIGGTDRLLEEGAREFIGATRTIFQKAYASAVRGGRERGDATLALPPARPAEKAISGRVGGFTTIAETGLAALGITR